MITHRSPPNRKRLRMDSPLPVGKKEKVRGTSLLSRLSRSIRKLSPKVAEEPQPMEEEPFDEGEDSVDDLEENEEEEAGKNLSFEENRKRFSAKGKSLLNTESRRPLRNLIGESAIWRKDDWSTQVGKTLPRTPVDEPRIYPDLSAVKEVVEPTLDEALRETDSDIQLKQKRSVRIKGQPPSRASERLKEQANQKIKTVESDPVEDTYLHIGGDPESGDEEFESSKSELESEAEENNKNIEDRVEHDLKRKQEVNPSDTKQNSSTFKYSSTPISRNQNLYTNPLQPAKGESTSFPKQQVDDQPGPSEVNKPKPVSQANTQPAPLYTLTTQKPSIPHPPAISLPKSYEVLYKCLQETGVSREDAAAGAKAVLPR
jgi:hypothetical protein